MYLLASAAAKTVKLFMTFANAQAYNSPLISIMLLNLKQHYNSFVNITLM